MAATITPSQDALLDDLLKAGRWSNKSEIVRHGLELVRREVEASALAPLSDREVSASYAAMSADEIADDAAMGRASLNSQSKGEQ